VLRGLTAALRAVHQRGITHRDVKPANVFFGATGEVKLGDFGASHLADLSATLTSAMVGTLAYMAPEQVTGGGQPSAATDLYALGVVAFQMLTGTLPFAGPDFVTQHLNEAPPLVSQRAPVLGTQYDALVSALLVKDAAARVQDANALHDCWLHSHGWTPRPTRWPPRRPRRSARVSWLPRPQQPRAWPPRQPRASPPWPASASSPWTPARRAAP
jgi:serine/threonine protein kinase